MEPVQRPGRVVPGRSVCPVITASERTCGTGAPLSQTALLRDACCCHSLPRGPGRHVDEIPQRSNLFPRLTINTADQYDDSRSRCPGPPGQSSARPLAIIAPTDAWKETLTPEALKAHLDRYVEEGKITNWAVLDLYVMVDEIPKTSLDKLDKKLLRTQHGTAL
jgi:acyl-CoA synthetase (AMP-forming)/AMP-acid ligase II